MSDASVCLPSAHRRNRCVPRKDHCVAVAWLASASGTAWPVDCFVESQLPARTSQLVQSHIGEMLKEWLIVSQAVA